MPSGQKPKVYPPGVVASVAVLYAEGRTQHEVAAALGLNQKVIWNLMRRHGIAARKAAKRDQRGARNLRWKGDEAGYQAFHLRVAAVRGTPSLCEMCGTTSAKTYDWASITRNYEDVNDYKRMCRSCHWKFDGTKRNLGKWLKGGANDAA